MSGTRSEWPPQAAVSEVVRESLPVGLLGDSNLIPLDVRSALTRLAPLHSYDPYIPLIKSQFTLVRPAVPSSSALHLLYATGRRNVLALHATLTLLPYHDIITLVYEFAWSIIEPTADISEGFTFGLTLGRGAAGLQGEGLGVWALVNKNSLKKVKEQRYDLVSGADGLVEV